MQLRVKVFFDEVNWYFAVLGQYFFDVLFIESTKSPRPTDEAHSLSPSISYFPALLFQVRALALQFLPPQHSSELATGGRDGEEIDRLSTRFSEQGEKLMRLLGRRVPNATNIQADLMCSAWQTNDGRGPEVWYSLSNATRQAQEIGLHLDTSQDAEMESTSSEVLKRLWFGQHKRRPWATLVI